jgi:hypothetical protein
VSKQQSIAKQNRQRNAGGVMPDPVKMTATLIKLFHQLNRSAFITVDKEKFIVVILYLWLTQRLERREYNENDTGQVPYEIPDCYRISGTKDCIEHAFRTVKHGSISWAEYAQPYPTKHGIVFLWQPIPESLNHLFQPFIAKQNYQVPWLDRHEKKRLTLLLSTKLCVPMMIMGVPSARKDTFMRYFTDCVRVDNQLSTMTKNVMLSTHKLHHHSSIAYQQEDSDRLRYKIFDAQERYITRLFSQVRISEWEALLSFSCSLSNSCSSTISLINKKSTLSTPSDFKVQGRIKQLRLINDTHVKETIADPAIVIGSSRSIEEHKVVNFFKQLNEEIIAARPKQRARLAQYIEYYNLCTHQIALMFVLLTATRPTHAISIERRRCFGYQFACVKDKGRLRQIILSTFLSQQIKHYVDLQKSLVTRLPSSSDCELLWYCYDHDGQPVALNAKSLRAFMHARLPGKVPYMLRHVFAQCALTSIHPVKLTTNQIDRLMGHSEWGEHFGSDHLFPCSLAQLSTHLNSLPARFKLMEIQYV